MKNRGLFLTIIIGVGGLLFFMLLGVGYRYLSESSAPDDDTLYDYDDYEHVESWEAIHAMDEDFFLVYVYDPSGEMSASLENDVCAFHDAHVEDFTVYFAALPLAGTPPTTIEAPAFMIYESGTLSSVRTDEAGIYSLLDDVESGLLP